jgi:cation transport ATPase
LLLRSADALLELNAVDTVALDKTGTVTQGAFEVIEAKAEVLRIAAGLERFSHHPIARAIVGETVARGIPLPRGEGVAETSGEGITGVVDGHRWWLRGGEPGEVVLCGADGPVGSIRLGDVVREDSLEAVRELERLGKSVTLLSGDHQRVGQRIGAEAGIGVVVAPLGPAAKADWIARQQAAGHRVLFGGDGLNDGPALARADVGVAMGTGAASSVLVADGVISVASIGPIVAGFQAATGAHRAIRLNQVRSIMYNVSAVAAAAVGLINPLVAAVLMPLSSGMVIWESARVERRVARALR